MMIKIERLHFPLIDSTSSWSIREAESLDKDVLRLVTADEQSKGKGRYGHAWVSPYKQNLISTFSFLIDKKRPDIGNLPQVIALSAVRLLSDYGLYPKLKWPNDVLIGHKKIAGVLCESTVIKGGAWLCLALSVGLNVNLPLETAMQFERAVTSLLIENGREEQLEVITEKLLNYFVVDLQNFLKWGFEPFISLFRSHLIHQSGDLIKFHTSSNEIIEGSFFEVTSEGALKLRLSIGSIREFISGEIF